MYNTKLATMAWRNLWRNRRRTLITLASLSFGSLLAVLFTGLGDSTYAEMIDLAARLGGGHVTLQHPEYLEKPAFTRTIQDVVNKGQRALEVDQVERYVARITGHVMLSTANNSSGATLLGLDPAREDQKTFALIDDFSQGQMFASSKDRGIILGSRLAKNLGIGLGKKVVYTLTDKKGEIISGLARVSGLISTGSAAVDLGLCLLPIDTVRDLLGYASDEATLVAIFIDDQRDSTVVKNRLARMLDDETAVLTWDQTQPDLAGFINMKVRGTNFFEILIMILVAAGIFNTIFVSVMERLREFGIMLAIGFSPGNLFQLVMWESLWLGLSGLVCAALITFGPYWYFNTTGLDMSSMVGKGGSEVAGVAVSPIMYVDIYPENLVAIAFAVLLATLLSGLYPALRAGRVVPVETIRLV